MPDPTQVVNEQIPPVANDSIPKTKSEWAELAKTDPGRFAELTQTNTDRYFREKKEAEERALAAETREKNLKAQLDALAQPPAVQPPVTEENAPKQFGNGIYPQSDEEWNNLFLENPTFATDLRNEYFLRVNKERQDFSTARRESARVVQQEHPDMYVLELEADGKPKKDSQGKLVLKIDPSTNLPIPNMSSDKGKIWLEIWNEDPQGWDRLKNTPRLMMAEMERRLRQKGANMINQGQNNSNFPDQSGVITEGVTPPFSGNLKFSSDAEKARAQLMVSRGTYKSLEEYVQWRDQPSQGYAEGNRFPDFSKK